MGYKNMIFDVMILNMERQLVELAHERFGKPLESCSDEETYLVVMLLIKRILEVGEKNSGEKKVYYVSAEFLTGRFLKNTLISLGILKKTEEILSGYGKKLSDVFEAEPEPALGCGGLGLLSACYMDSIATLGYPAVGIGLNYRYGLFRQSFGDRVQQMAPDRWMQWDSWEKPTEVTFDVRVGGKELTARMYEISIVGYKSGINKLRLFDIDSADSSIVHDGIRFDKEDIEKNLTLFLYPDDSDGAGKRLRLYQQYFLVSCAAQLILRDMKALKCDLRKMFDYAVIQINESHPALLIPELIRILTEDKALSFREAAEVVTRSCAYTNHTIMAEALDTWSLEDLTRTAPQLVPVIQRLDLIVREKYQDPSVWIIDEEGRARMANLCVHFCFSVNGVSKSHTQILENERLRGFYQIYPERFSNKTNGISFRRWLLGCNPELAEWICSKIGNGYKLDPSQLGRLSALTEDEFALAELDAIKQKAKSKLAAFIRKKEGTALIPEGIFDLQANRIHEYKRQQLAALYVIRTYLGIRNGKFPARPINFIFGGKAEPGYTMAEDILHLLLVLQDVVNGDPEVNPYLRVAVVTNFNVTYAERLIPAAEISEQISLASRESSGTGNMKLLLNGALTLGTRDGANAEIGELAGEENVYFFGIGPDEAIRRFDSREYDPAICYENSACVREAVDFIKSAQMMSLGQEERLSRLYDELRFRDRYMTLLDFASYTEVKDRMLRDYEDRTAWNRKALTGIACAGYFSADRAVAEYNRDIWKLKSFQTYSEEGK